MNKNELDVEIQEDEQEESRFSFDNVATLTKIFRYHDIGASSYCEIHKS